MERQSVPRPLDPSHAPDLLTANLPSPEHTRPDPRLQLAVQEACRVHQVTPILKEELRAAIMLRRLSNGQGEITRDDDSPPADCQLTSDEVAKQERRRAQNRLAAQRCRIKKRQEQEQFLQVFTEQNSKRQKLENDVLELREEKRRLEALLVHHMLTRACQKGHVTSAQDNTASSLLSSISNHTFEEESFYDLFQTDLKKENPGDTSAHMLPNDLEPELPGDETSLIYSLDSRQLLSDLNND